MPSIYFHVFADWSYTPMAFTYWEMIQSVAFLSSFVVTVLTSTTWHHIQLAKMGNLSLSQEVMVMPFFLSTILMKCLIPGTLESILAKYYHPALSVTVILSLFVYQIILQKSFGFKNKEVVIGRLYF